MHRPQISTPTPPSVARTTRSTTAELARSPIWLASYEHLSSKQRAGLSYERSKAVAQHYRLTADDVRLLSEHYWRFHSDPLLISDASVGTILTIQYNLCLGTILKYIKNRPDLQPVVDKLLTFEWNGQYCLTELGHGLDVINMETRATQLSDGSFELHTPTDSAAKHMPPTSPSGYPCVAVVNARLFVDGEDRGPKVFLVDLHDGTQMHPGVVSKVLGTQSSRAMRHCLTYFHRVRLPPSALLSDPSKPKFPREAFFDNISRAITGTISMGALGVSAIQISSYIAAKYSLRRHVIDHSTQVARPIISFSTQYIPVLSAVAHSLILRIFSDYCHGLFVSAEDPTMKHLIAAIFKTTAMKAAHSAMIELSDRCGAQGLSEVNQMTTLHLGTRGAAIAEGDILVISILFAMEILRNRIAVPRYIYPDSLLARHERSLISTLRASLANAPSHRDQSVDMTVLPLCQSLIEAIGARMAYEAASGSLDEDILNLFVASNIRKDAAWYAVNEGLDTAAQVQKEAEAAMKLLPRTNTLLDMLEMEPYAVAPITSDEQWRRYVDSLETYGEEMIPMSKL